MKLRRSQLTFEELLEGARGRFHPLDPKSTSAQAFWVRPGKQVQLVDSGLESDGDNERFIAVSFAGEAPIRIHEASEIHITQRKRNQTVEVFLSSAVYAFQPDCIVFERLTLDPTDPALVHMKFLVCTEENSFGLPELA